MTKHTLTARIALLLALAAFVPLAAQEAPDTGALTLLNTRQYSEYFGFTGGNINIRSNYIWAASDTDIEKFGMLNFDASKMSREDTKILTDTPLEFALLSYYSPEVLSVRPEGADAILPANNPRIAGLKLGSAVLKELAEIRFFASNPLSEQDRNTIGRYEGMIKFISDRNGVSRADMQDYLARGIAAVVNKYYSQRGMFDITPSLVYAEWKRNGVSRGLDGLQIVKDKLSAFYLSPTAENFAALRGIFASYNETEERYSDPLAYEAGRAFSRTLRELNNPLWGAVVDDKRTASAAIAAAGSAGKDLGIFSLPYTTGGGR